MTPEDRERLRANAQAAMERVDAMNGKGGGPEYSSDERPFPDEILELLDELDMWRAAREDALDEMERAEDTRDAIMADLRKERARIKAVHELAEEWSNNSDRGWYSSFGDELAEVLAGRPHG